MKIEDIKLKLYTLSGGYIEFSSINGWWKISIKIFNSSERMLCPEVLVDTEDLKDLLKILLVLVEARIRK